MLVEREARVVGDLPDVAVRIGEARRVPSVERLAGRSCQRRPCGLRGRDNLLDLYLRADVVGENDTVEGTAPGVRDTRITSRVRGGSAVNGR